MIAGPTIITGGGRGIGVHIARRVAAEGGAVSLWGRNAEALERVAAELSGGASQVHTAVVDVSQEDQVAAAVESTRSALGGIRGVVNNAGVANPGPFEELSVAEWDELFAINTRGVMLVTKYTLPELRAGGGGAYVNLVSEVGRLNQADNVAYGASKAAVVSFTQGLGAELAASGIRVNAVAPGPVETDMWDGAVRKRAGAEGKTPQEFREAVLSKIPSGRFSDPGQIAEVVAFLLDDEKSGAILAECVMATSGSTIF